MNNVCTRFCVRVSNRFAAIRAEGAERGLTTTEVAVLTFILVALAVAVGAFIVTYTNDTLDQIDQLERPVIDNG